MAGDRSRRGAANRRTLAGYRQEGQTAQGGAHWVPAQPRVAASAWVQEKGQGQPTTLGVRVAGVRPRPHLLLLLHRCTARVHPRLMVLLAAWPLMDVAARPGCSHRHRSAGS